jgi:hypothetical protein
MKDKIIKIYKTIGIMSIIPIMIYLVLLVPITIIFTFTWLLSPFQPENFSDLELLKN